MILQVLFLYRPNPASFESHLGFITYSPGIRRQKTWDVQLTHRRTTKGAQSLSFPCMLKMSVHQQPGY
jgi:hypothetical protein